MFQMRRISTLRLMIECIQKSTISTLSRDCNLGVVEIVLPNNENNSGHFGILPIGFNRRPLHCSQIQSSTNSSIWDDSGWMNHGDSNAEAYNELDITKLRPFPEFRNVATGPVWPANAYELVWRKYYDSQMPKHEVAKQNEEWCHFLEDHGHNPDEYFTTEEFIDRYQDQPLWKSYRRNHKGSRPRQKTREYCLVFGKSLDKGNPCPLCRDKKLLINYRNLPLLHHFIDPFSGAIYHTLRTGVCRRRHGILVNAIWLARDQGLLPQPAL